MEETNTLESIMQRLDQLSEQVREIQNQVAQLNDRVQKPRVHTEHPHIVRIDGVKGGEPIVRGKGITVQTLVVLSRQMAVEQLLVEYDGQLTPAEIYDALSYYYDHPGEIDQYIAENRAALESVWHPRVSS